MHRDPVLHRASLAHRIPQRAAALAIALAALASPLAARADDASDAELAAARQIFKEGKQLEAGNAWADALERFRKVGAVKMTPQVRFHIALCEEHLGHLVAAINGFELGAEEAQRPGANADDVATNAPERAKALRERVPTLRIDIEGEVRTSRVLLDGAPVAAALIGTAIPVDPGEHRVEVETKGRIVSTKEVKLEERGAEKVTVEVNDPDHEPEVAPPPPVKKEAPPPATGTRLPAVVAGGIGVASLVGAGVFLGMRESTIADIRATCVEDARCDPTLQDEADQGRTYTTAANVLIGVGAAGLVTGGVLWFVLGPKEPVREVGVTPTAQGVVVSGRF